MTTSTITRQPAGTPTGGEFSRHDRADGAVNLTVGPGDSLRGLDHDEVAILTLGFLDRIDALSEQSTGAETAAAGIIDGKRHAYAEIVTRILDPSLDDESAEIAAAAMLNDRWNGVKAEEADRFDLPDVSATERAQLVSNLTRRADELFVEADSGYLPADVTAHTYGRFEAISEAALDLRAA